PNYAPYIAKAAAAVGVDGYFIEVHPNPAIALSDGSNMLSLNSLKNLLNDIL
ncbi:MAG TPA: 3-deoxy-8-phosphooctulonate synthase, partial [Bacteroidia bacterium]|nr:3-deoxy-8-phosphooctulonate synthase [Bacteroidia bacterium]